MAEQFELDKGDNLIFLLDVSASMGQTDTPTGATRIEYAKERAIALANEAAKYDEDGVDLITFGEKVKHIGKVTGTNAGDLIGPLKANEGSTNTAGAIQKAYDIHKSNKYQQTFCFLVTDGAPDSKDAVRDVIRNIASEIKDEHEFCIGFLIAGDLEKNPGLKAFLTELDDELKAKHDIVDVKVLAEVESLIQVAAAALHD